jgi:MerR family copper efflux transcriptional regulator
MMLTIHEAATTTGWSPRMLRYVEQLGLVEPARSSAGYRLYGPAQLQRLRTLRELLETHGVRLRREPELSKALDTWFDTTPIAPEGVPDSDWLGFEQDKHQHLLTPTPR